MNELELKEKMQRAEHAKRITEDKLVKEALAGIRDNLYQKIRASSFKDAEGRENCYRLLRAVDEFEAQFKKWMDDGKVAQSTWEKLKNIMR